MRTYILDDARQAVRADERKWKEWRAEADRRVAFTTVGEASVSTVFLGQDHSFEKNGPPLLFETMVFGGPQDGEMERCSTWAEAEAMHARMCERLREEDEHDR